MEREIISEDESFDVNFEKQDLIDYLDSLIDLQIEAAKLRHFTVPIVGEHEGCTYDLVTCCALNSLDSGIHIYNIKNLIMLLEGCGIEIGDILVVPLHSDDIEYKYEVSFMYRGAKFFGLEKELDNE